MICISRAEPLPAYRTPCETKNILKICDTLCRVIPINPFIHNVEKWHMHEKVKYDVIFGAILRALSHKNCLLLFYKKDNF